MLKQKLIICHRIPSGGERDEMIYHIVSKCSKQAQKEYKIRHDWMGKGIHQELCKRLNFDHATKQYRHKSEYILENETKFSENLRYKQIM